MDAKPFTSIANHRPAINQLPRATKLISDKGAKDGHSHNSIITIELYSYKLMQVAASINRIQFGHSDGGELNLTRQVIITRSQQATQHSWLLLSLGHNDARFKKPIRAAKVHKCPFINVWPRNSEMKGIH